MFEKVLVPLDGSQFSGRALPYAIEIAKRFGGEVILFQVVKQIPVVVPTAGGDAMAGPVATKMLIESAEVQNRRDVDRANRYLRKQLKKVVAQDVSGSYKTVIGEPAETIIDFCHKKAIDLVVMTTSGKSGLKRTLLGSVADKVIREPGIPVLAIRPKRRKTKKK